MRNIGLMYQNALGVERNYAEAMKWYRKAADRGFAGAMVSIASMYENGLGVERDLAEIRKWYTQAADAGDPVAKQWFAEKDC
jgi:uncharacterized protein